MDAVYDHKTAEAAFIFIYAFHMPLFLFVSGLFVRREGLTYQKAASRVVFFLILGFGMKMILRIVPLCFGIDIKFTLLSDAGLPWYMFAMAAYYALAYLLRCVNPKVILVFSVLMALFVGYDSSVGDFLCLSRIIVYLPFFWLGHMLDPKTLETTTDTRAFKVVAALMVVAFAVVCIMQTDAVYSYRWLFTGRNCYESIPIDGCSWVNRLIAYAISAVVCIGVIGITPRRNLGFVSVAGTRTL